MENPPTTSPIKKGKIEGARGLGPSLTYLSSSRSTLSLYVGLKPTLAKILCNGNRKKSLSIDPYQQHKSFTIAIHLHQLTTSI
jgi:hypothetical protein